MVAQKNGLDAAEIHMHLKMVKEASILLCIFYYKFQNMRKGSEDGEEGKGNE